MELELLVSDVIDVLKETSINVLYVCTMPSQTSTFGEFFDEFQKVIKKYYPGSHQNVHFVSNLIDEGTEAVKYFDENMTLIEKSSKNMLDYLNDSRKIFDVIIFAQCTNLEQMFNLGKYKNDLIPPFNKIFLSSLSENGLLVNFYYDRNNKAAFTNLEEFYSAPSFDTFLFHIYYQEILNRFFTNISKGIYRKNKISEKEYSQIFDEAMLNIFQTIPGLIDLQSKEKSVNEIANDISKTYFNGTLNETELGFLVNGIKKVIEKKQSKSSKQRVSRPETLSILSTPSKASNVPAKQMPSKSVISNLKRL